MEISIDRQSGNTPVINTTNNTKLPKIARYVMFSILLTYFQFNTRNTILIK